jgi:hypothetical protein
MRLHRVSRSEVAEIVATGNVVRWDQHGRPIYAGRTADGRRMEVVVALDEPDYAITVFGEVE